MYSVQLGTKIATKKGGWGGNQDFQRRKERKEEKRGKEGKREKEKKIIKGGKKERDGK